MLRLSTLLLMTASLAGDAQAESVPLNVPEGFHASLYADETLVHDVFSLTLDAQGRVVVSGRGYIHTLLDNDGDGRAETIQQFADGPKTGAQGLYFDGTDLIASGDAGVIRYRDADGDGKADGPPETLLAIKAGNEHEVHSVQKGPDGYWYVIAGNFAGVTLETITAENSPVSNPQAGVVMRLSPDFKEVEVIGDGFRNAYDFAFDSAGDIFTYDSDGERDISLPWYRPTRVFRVAPGSNAGWVSQSWKWPNDYLDMMPVVANCGRGSPTGVVCYRHRQFPESYRDAIFALDWTYGRVLVVRLDENGEPTYDEPELFMSAAGDYGFAPTDAEVGPDGSLYVSVGGRGLRGSVYRVTYEDGDSTVVDESTDALTQCLNAPQPLASWSRASWIPAAEKLGRQPFVQAVLDQKRTTAQRMRAIEVLSERFGGVDEKTLHELRDDGDFHLRARAVKAAAYNVGSEVLTPYLRDENPRVQRAVLETLLTRTEFDTSEEFAKSLALSLDGYKRTVPHAAARVVGRLPTDILTAVGTAGDKQLKFSNLRPIRFMYGKSRREPLDVKLAVEASRFGISMLRNESSGNFNADAIRLMQIVWGDMGPKAGRAPVYDGYAPTLDLSHYKSELGPLKRELAALYPQTTSSGFRAKTSGYELARLLAMLEVNDEKTRNAVLARVDEESDPVDDIHYLIVFSRLPGERSDEQRSRTASALLALDRKLNEKNYQTESHWEDRVGEMYAQLVAYDPALPVAILKHPEFGRPVHVLLLDQLPEEHLQAAIDAFTTKIAAADGDYPWTTDVIFLLNAAKKPEDIALIRDQYDDPLLQAAITIALAEEPEAGDREKFVSGLSSWQYEVLEASTNALSTLGATKDPGELVALLAAVRRLGAVNAEYPLREKLAKLLEESTGIDAGFVYGEAGHIPQQPALDQWTAELTKRYPNEVTAQLGTSKLELSDLQERLTKIDWNAGDAARGQVLFQKRSCGHCHGGSQALGPNLSGVTRRFSTEELFTAIVFPNRDVSPRYQASSVITKEGKVYHGMIIYESVDGFILRNATLQTHRFNTSDVESRTVSSTSMMPAGLLKDLSDGDWADLYAYLQGLK
ncbi:MAG: PVC-type heme-binding CxxCH protein [Planctomycetaceae bacterium]